MTKNLKKNYCWKIFLIFFGSKTTFYLSLGHQKERPSWRRSLQLSKEAIQHFKTWHFWIFSTFVGHFCPPGSVSGSTDPIESGSNWDPDPQKPGTKDSHQSDLKECCGSGVIHSAPGYHLPGHSRSGSLSDPFYSGGTLHMSWPLLKVPYKVA